jgi:hypothetical protein
MSQLPYWLTRPGSGVSTKGPVHTWYEPCLSVLTFFI